MGAGRPLPPVKIADQQLDGMTCIRLDATVVTAHIAALPPGRRRRLMVTCDGAGASHDLVKELDRLASRHGYQLTSSFRWALGARERDAVGKVPASAWEAAVDGKARSARAAPSWPAGTRAAPTRPARWRRRTSPS